MCPCRSAREDTSPGQHDLAWLLAKRDWIAPIPGTNCRRSEQLSRLSDYPTSGLVREYFWHTSRSTHTVSCDHETGHLVAGKFEVYENRPGKFRFRLKASNGEVVAQGETKSNAHRGAEATQRAAEGA